MLLSPKERYDSYVQDCIANDRMPLSFPKWNAARTQLVEMEVIRMDLSVTGQNGFITFNVCGIDHNDRMQKAQQLFDKYLEKRGFETTEQNTNRQLQAQIKRDVKQIRKHYDKAGGIKKTTDKYAPDMARKTKTLLANISKFAALK